MGMAVVQLTNYINRLTEIFMDFTYLVMVAKIWKYLLTMISTAYYYITFVIIILAKTATFQRILQECFSVAVTQAEMYSQLARRNPNAYPRC